MSTWRQPTSSAPSSPIPTTRTRSTISPHSIFGRSGSATPCRCWSAICASTHTPPGRMRRGSCCWRAGPCWRRNGARKLPEARCGAEQRVRGAVKTRAARPCRRRRLAWTVDDDRRLLLQLALAIAELGDQPEDVGLQLRIADAVIAADQRHDLATVEGLVDLRGDLLRQVLRDHPV